MKKTIGFFGGSYCADKNNDFSIKNNFKTYIEHLEEYYNFDIVHLGVPGASVWDIWLKQFLPFVNTNSVPDVCVFIWTDYFRIYHPIVRNLSPTTAWLFNPRNHSKDDNKMVWTAAKQYYQYLSFEEQKLLEYKSALYYFDHVVLKSLPSTTKIVHLWSFGEEISNLNTDPYLYDWNIGTEIRPDLMKVSLMPDGDQDFIFNHTNHLNDSYKNLMVFEWIKEAIDNYSDRQVSYELIKYKKEK